MKPTSITGRDGYIVRQALAYAIVAINRLPEDHQEISNRDDMLAILEHYCDDDGGDSYLLNARSHLEGRGIEVVDGKLQLAEVAQ